MNHRRTIGFFLGTLALALGSALTLVVQRVRAAGVPATAALTYTGYLESPDGTPVNGSKPIALYIYDAATAGNIMCQVVSGSPTTLTSGRFQILLPETCTAAVKANPDLYVEVQVEGLALGRTKLGAVPYAMEAGHAMAADSASNAAHAAAADSATSSTSSTTASSAAAATGALDSRIAAIETKIVGLETRQKVVSGNVYFSNGSCASVATACAIDISAAGYTATPSCTISMQNVDNTGYTEHMVIHSVSSTQLKVWRGQYYQTYGTTMNLNYMCSGT